MITQTICKTLKFRIMNSINNATMTVNNQETVINSSTVINMEEVTKNSKGRKGIAAPYKEQG